MKAASLKTCAGVFSGRFVKRSSTYTRKALCIEISNPQTVIVSCWFVHSKTNANVVFFDEHGDIKVGDFGLAVSHNHESSHDDLQLALHEKHSRSSVISC